MPFIADEPLLQMILDKHFQSHTFPIVGLGGSSIPFAYGASALWIYGAARLFVSSLEALVLVHGILYSLGIVALYFLLRRRVSREITWLVLWLGFSSPFLFFYSRMLWDNTFCMPSSALLLLLLDRLDQERPTQKLLWALLGFGAGFMINIHLMTGAFVLAAGITALCILARAKLDPLEKLKYLLIALAVFIATITPYVYEAVVLYPQQGALDNVPHRELWGNGRNLWWLLQRSVVWLSTWKAHDFFGVAYPSFEVFVGKTWALLFRNDFLGWFEKLFALSYILGLLVDIRRGRRLDAIQICLVLSFFSVLVVYNLLNIPTEAHYFHPVWWMGFLALGLGLNQLQQNWRRVMIAITLYGAVLNTAFIFESSQYVEANHGMRNLTYGIVMKDIRARLEEICGKMHAKQVKLNFDVLLMIHPMHYFNHHLAACADKELLLVQSKNEADWNLVYQDGASGSSAEVIWEKGGRSSGN